MKSLAYFLQTPAQDVRVVSFFEPIPDREEESEGLMYNNSVLRRKVTLSIEIRCSRVGRKYQADGVEVSCRNVVPV